MCELFEVILKLVFVEYDSCCFKEAILEVVKVPLDRTLIETLSGMALAVVKTMSATELNVAQISHSATQESFFLACEGMSDATATNLVPQDVLGFAAQVFLNVDHVVFTYSINCWDRKALLLEMIGHIDECIVFFT